MHVHTSILQENNELAMKQEVSIIRQSVDKEMVDFFEFVMTHDLSVIRYCYGLSQSGCQSLWSGSRSHEILNWCANGVQPLPILNDVICL